MSPLWLDGARRMQAIAQNGLTFARDPFDRGRYGQLRPLAAEVMAAGSTLPVARAVELFRAEIG